MAAPSAPTSTTITNEAFKKFGIASPSSAQATRAIDYILEAVKDDIWKLSKKWRSLQTFDYVPTVSGVPHYQAPTDFQSDLQIILLDGNSRSTLATGSASAPVLNSAETAAKSDVEGKLLLITAGTGVNQAKHVKTYTVASQTCAMAENYTLAPATGDSYLIVTSHHPLGAVKAIRDYDRIMSPGLLARPTEAFHVPDTAEGDFYLYPVPDKVYGLLRRYYSNLKELDLAGTLYTRILWQWRDVFTLGCFYYLCADYGDKRTKDADKDYRNALMQLKATEVDGLDMSNLQRHVEE